MKLRPYQYEIVELLKTKGDKLIQAPTGAGKTIIFSKYIAESGHKCLVLAHRGELIRQAADKLEKATGLKCGVFNAGLGRKEINDITVASIQSLANYKGNLDFDDIIIDECHRVPPKSKESQYKSVLDKAKGRLIGFTATPYRLDIGHIYGKDEWWPDLDYQIPLRQLIDEEYLTDYKHLVSQYSSKIKSDVKKLKVTAGEYNLADAGDLMAEKMNVHAVLNSVPKERRHIVVFCVNILHAEALYDACNETKGIVHSKTSRDDLEVFDRGEMRWLFNVGVLTEGWDCPRVDAVVLARPTKSCALYVQMVGRGLRLHKGKDWCYIYDIVSSYSEFGLVDNPRVNIGEERGVGESKPKVCSECFSVFIGQVCPECGFEEKKPVVIDEEDDCFEMKEVVFEQGKVLDGWAEMHNDDCIKVTYRHNKEGYISHFYTLKKEHYHWMGVKMAGIIRRYYDFSENWIHPKRFLNAINSKVLFPMEGLEVYEDKNGYKKISSL